MFAAGICGQYVEFFRKEIPHSLEKSSPAAVYTDETPMIPRR